MNGNCHHVSVEADWLSTAMAYDLFRTRAMCGVLHLSSFTGLSCFWKFCALFWICEHFSFSSSAFHDKTARIVILACVQKNSSSLLQKDSNGQADRYWFASQRTTTVIATEGSWTWCVFRHILWTFKIEAYQWVLTSISMILCLPFLSMHFERNWKCTDYNNYRWHIYTSCSVS